MTIPRSPLVDVLEHLTEEHRKAESLMERLADTDPGPDRVEHRAIGGLATGIVLLMAYLFGGYVAGRMARRAGLLHGAAVAVLSIVGGGIAGALISEMPRATRSTATSAASACRHPGDEWSAVTVATAIVAVAAVIIGAAAGGLLGERWHARLLARAADPERGLSAEARRRAEELEAERDRLVQQEMRPVGASENGDRDLQRREAEAHPTANRADVDRSDIDLRDDQPDENEPRYTAAEWEAFGSTRNR